MWVCILLLFLPVAFLFRINDKIFLSGQAVKEIVCRERPQCPPVIRLQKRWSEEYGMPSTHAMASIAIPAGLFYYVHQRYEVY